MDAPPIQYARTADGVRWAPIGANAHVPRQSPAAPGAGRGKGFTFADRGEATLKGFLEPVRLFVVGEAE